MFNINSYSWKKNRYIFFFFFKQRVRFVNTTFYDSIPKKFFFNILHKYMTNNMKYNIIYAYYIIDTCIYFVTGLGERSSFDVTDRGVRAIINKLDNTFQRLSKPPCGNRVYRKLDDAGRRMSRLILYDVVAVIRCVRYDHARAALPPVLCSRLTLSSMSDVRPRDAASFFHYRFVACRYCHHCYYYFVLLSGQCRAYVATIRHG